MNTIKKIGAVKLSGLIIGPILGSGILILPPLAVEVMGDWAILGWIVMVTLSFIFATVFGQLSILFPGDAGVTAAIEVAFGKGIRQLAAFYLTGAALFGPVAVLLTVSKYLGATETLSEALLAFLFVGIALFVLINPVNFIGTLSFIMSSAAGVILFSGSITCLLGNRKEITMPDSFEPASFGYGLLLLFWTIVGWEIIGNFTGDVKNPKKTLPRAIIYSAIVIALISLVVASGFQWIDTAEPLSVKALLYPLFGKLSPVITGFLALFLCLTTYISFTGAVGRLINSIASKKSLPYFLSTKNLAGAPSNAIFTLVSIHSIILLCVMSGVFDLEKLVSIADGFFLANALLGVFTAVKLFNSLILKAVSAFLGMIFLTILGFSSIYVIAVIIIMALFIPFMDSHGFILPRKLSNKKL